jgi:hypothetical protein
MAEPVTWKGNAHQRDCAVRLDLSLGPPESAHPTARVSPAATRKESLASLDSCAGTGLLQCVICLHFLSAR